jgi:hypothetical protein
MRRVVAAGAMLLLAASAMAIDPIALRSLLSKEADVYTPGPGLVRLDLPPEVIAECLSNLADVRLFDLEGNEIPFLLDSPRVDAVFEVERVEARPLEVRREETPRRQGLSLRRETFELDGPTTVARGGEWRLVVDVAHPEFVARARASWNKGGSEAKSASDGSLFRLSSPRRVEKLGLPLGAGSIGRVVVVLEHEQKFWLEPSFRFESSRTIERRERAAIPLTVLSTRSSGGKTVVELARPRGVVPATLRLGASTATFDRKLTVHDDGAGRDPAPLGEANLFRLLPGGDVEELELPLRPARGDRLRVVIDDGDSPALTNATFTAVFGQPSLVASLTAAGGPGPAATLRFGGGRASVPRYDLAGFSPQLGREVYGKRAEALVRLYDPAAVGIARLGAVRPNPAFDRTPALAFAMRSGASIDARAFARRRTLHVEPSPEGLSRLRLSPEDLAALRPDLADLRIVDAESRQWPYLVERSDAAIEVPQVIASSSKDRATTYRLASAVSPLTVDRLAIDTDVPFFDRGFELRGDVQDGKETVLSRGRLARAAGDPSPVTIDVPAARVKRMELRVEDGDDAPLVLRSIRARGPVPEVYLAAPAGSYTMLLGADDSAAPRYELERVRDVVLAVGAGDVRSEPIEPNPDYKLSARFMQGKGREQAILWGAIIAAVVVLGALTLRLARHHPAS